MEIERYSCKFTYILTFFFCRYLSFLFSSSVSLLHSPKHIYMPIEKTPAAKSKVTLSKPLLLDMVAYVSIFTTTSTTTGMNEPCEAFSVLTETTCQEEKKKRRLDE